MNQQAINDYFKAYPVLVECFETSDGVLHHSEQQANKWVERNPNKEIICHDNPAFAIVATKVAVAETAKTVTDKGTDQTIDEKEDGQPIK